MFYLKKNVFYLMWCGVCVLASTLISDLIINIIISELRLLKIHKIMFLIRIGHGPEELSSILLYIKDLSSTTGLVG